jgi:hypothetical protein
MNTEHHLNEWNLHTEAKKRDVPLAAAKTLGFMLMMQNTSTDVMCYYDGVLKYSDYGGIINPDHGYPYRTYYSFMMFNTLYKLKNSVGAESSDSHVFVGAGVNGRKAALVIANVHDELIKVDLDLCGFSATDVQFCRIDDGNRYTVTGE